MRRDYTTTRKKKTVYTEKHTQQPKKYGFAVLWKTERRGESNTAKEWESKPIATKFNIKK